MASLPPATKENPWADLYPPFHSHLSSRAFSDFSVIIVGEFLFVNPRPRKQSRKVHWASWSSFPRVFFKNLSGRKKKWFSTLSSNRAHVWSLLIKQVNALGIYVLCMRMSGFQITSFWDHIICKWKDPYKYLYSGCNRQYPCQKRN